MIALWSDQRDRNGTQVSPGKYTAYFFNETSTTFTITNGSSTGIDSVNKTNNDDIINISNDEGISTSHQIISNDDLFIVWQDNSTGNHEIYFSKIKNSDNRLNLNKTINISNSPGISSDPKIDFFSSNIYIIWEEYVPSGGSDIFFRPSYDNGNSFGNITNLSESITDSFDPEVGR